jgi:DNA polymerase-3 subunit beta
MNFIVSSKTLALALQKTNVLFQKQPIVPITDTYLFQCTPEQLTITYTTLSQTYAVSIYHESKDTFSFCIDARRIRNFITKLEEQPIVVTLHDNNKVSISFCYGSLTMDIDNSDDFPRTVTFEHNYRTEIKSSFFIPSIKRLRPALSDNDLRPALTGMLFIFTDKLLTLVSTDGHQLYSTEIIGDWDETLTDRVILSRKSIEHIIALFSQAEPIQIRFNVAMIQFIQGQKKYQAKLIQERYPDYESLVKIEPTRILKVNKKLLTQMLKKLYPFLNSVTRQIKLSISAENIVFEVKNHVYGIEYKEQMDILDYQGEPIEIGFSQSILLTCIENTLSENIIIEFTEANKAVFIRPAENLEKINDYKMLMPVMLNYHD